MKYKIYFLLLSMVAYSGCESLDLNPLSEGSSATWYSSESEIEMSVNDLYRDVFWPENSEDWTDDWTYRNGLTPITDGTINGEWGTINTIWTNSYKAIARANTLLANLDNAKDFLPQEKIDQYAAEARFNRASRYSYLISHWGDVIYYENVLDLEESFTKELTSKEEILQNVYEDYDFAIEHLPLEYGSQELKRATKGAAMAMKARIALYMSDWAVARDAAKASMDLDVYKLYPDFGALFLSKTRNTQEAIFSIPRSAALGESFSTNNWITRNSGGWGAYTPSWDLLAAFLCTDGLPIDKSPLFDPQKPFENRDPRCTATIVEFGTRHLGFIYHPHPDSLEVYNFNTGTYQTNNDTRSNAIYASYNGLVWKKGIDEDWADDNRTDPDKIIIRYADVLLMYAEAKIELGEIDQSVHDAINEVRARAYGVDMTQTSDYPAVTTTDIDELKTIIKFERRMEFANEGTRYMDIIRWRLAEKALNRNIYGMLDVDDLKANVVEQGLWFWSRTPEIDEDGIPDFSPLYNDGKAKLLATRSFNEEKQYLWPIPTKEILINSNLKQNKGY